MRSAWVTREAVVGMRRDGRPSWWRSSSSVAALLVCASTSTAHAQPLATVATRGAGGPSTVIRGAPADTSVEAVDVAPAAGLSAAEGPVAAEASSPDDAGVRTTPAGGAPRDVVSPAALDAEAPGGSPALISTTDVGVAGPGDGGSPVPGAASAPPSSRPWRLAEALRAPTWLTFGLEHRARVEHLEHDYRATSAGSPTAVALRTLVSAELRFAPLVIGAELQDSRFYATPGAPLAPTMVNPLELLQASVGLRHEGLLLPGDAASLRLGRLTLDLGSRRLLARNDFRNTINAFTGADLRWTHPVGHHVRAFAVMPVARLPVGPEALAANRVEFDRENVDALVWGAFASSAPLGFGLQLEAAVLGLQERDGAVAQSSNRRLVTPFVRVVRPSFAGQVDVQLELMGQLGASRASVEPADAVDLAHRAASVHASVGYRLDVPFRPRVGLEYDYATGDEDPSDGVNGRFDPLFGARRFEFGPTSLYGVLARSNLNSPGLRVELAPHRLVDVLLVSRLAWLASARDAWTTAGLRDASGASGTFVGTHLEGRVRWQVLPGNLALDAGCAGLFHGAFARATAAGRPAQTLFVYSQLTGTL